MWINHNSDGAKTFTISSFTGWLYENHNYSSNGGSYSLDKIPRQATITAAPDFTDLDNPTITYSNPAGNAIADLKACISFTGSKDDIAYRDISKTGSTYTFNLTNAERDVLRNNTGSSREVIFYVRSVIGSVTYYSTLKKKLTIAESDATRPTVKITSLSPVSSLGAPLNTMYIQGKTKVKATLEIGTKYGASVAFSDIVVDYVSYPSYESAVLSKFGVQQVNARVKDSRGFWGTYYENVTVISYGKPLVVPLSGENAIHCYRSDGNGNRTGSSTSLWVKAKRSYNTLSGSNTCELQWRVKPAEAAWNDSQHKWSNLLGTDVSVNEYNAQVAGVFDLTKSYTVQIRAIDLVGEYDIKTFEIPTQDVALHLGKGGKNVSIGTYCDYSEERTFYSEWKAIFGDDVYIGDKTLKEYILNVINGGG